MHVLVQKEVGSRWLNRFVVLVLVAIIAIQLSTYLTPEKDVAGEQARMATVIEGMRVQHQREQSELAETYRREKAEADAKVARLSQKSSEIQSESDQKLAKLAAALGQQKAALDQQKAALDQKHEEAARQMAEHTQWLARIADQVAKTKRDSVAAKGAAKPMEGLNIRLVIPLMRVAELDDEEGADLETGKEAGAEAGCR